MGDCAYAATRRSATTDDTQTMSPVIQILEGGLGLEDLDDGA